MKKLIIATALFLAAGLSFAAEVGVSAVRDNVVQKEGVRVDAAVGQLGYVTPKLQATVVQDAYTRYAAVADIPLGKGGAVNVVGTVGAVYQDTSAVLGGVNGYGMTVGAKASMDLTKSITVNAGVERFIGQDRLNKFNGNTLVLGLSTKF